MEGNVSFYQVNLVSRITGEGGGGVLKDVGAWFYYISPDTGVIYLSLSVSKRFPPRRECSSDISSEINQGLSSRVGSGYGGPTRRVRVDNFPTRPVILRTPPDLTGHDPRVLKAS